METAEQRKRRWAKIAEMKQLEKKQRLKRLKSKQASISYSESDSYTHSNSVSDNYTDSEPQNNESSSSDDSDTESSFDFEEEQRQRRIRIAKMKRLEKQQREQRLLKKQKSYYESSEDSDSENIHRLHRKQISDMKRLESLERSKRLRKNKTDLNKYKQSLLEASKSSQSSDSDEKEEIHQKQSVDSADAIRFYTLYDMVELVTSPEVRGTQDQIVLLYTYCLYSRPKELLHVIFERLENTSANNKAQIKVMALLRTWLKIEPEFSDATFGTYFKNELIAQTQHNQVLIHLSMPIVTQLCTGAQQNKHLIRDRHISFAAAPTPQIQKIQKTRLAKNIDFNQLNAVEIARQICLLEYDIFKKIKPEEFLKQKNKVSGNPNIDKMTDWFNKLVVWTQCEIMFQRQVTKRAKAIALILKICDALEKYNNISSLCAIRAGLCSVPIHRLHKTWQNISKKSKEIKAKIDELFKLGNGQKNLRDRVAIISQPAIPHLGLFLGDIVFIDDGNETFKTSDAGLQKINWRKMKMLSERIAWISMFQQSPYVFKTVPIICEYLKSRMKLVPEDFLYKLSREVEPPQKKRKS